MKIYRVAYYTQQDSSEGYDFTFSKSDAEKKMRKFKKDVGDDFDERSEIDVHEFPLTKKGIFSLLQRVASHPNNG